MKHDELILNDHRKGGVMEPKDISKKHFYISLVKSLVRIAASVALIMSGIPYVVMAGWLLGIAEVLGIAEEI
jgi:hypothetical protein